jgi:hypothetical protein
MEEMLVTDNLICDDSFIARVSAMNIVLIDCVSMRVGPQGRYDSAEPSHQTN